MTRHRGRIVLSAALALSLLTACTPSAQNGDTVSLPALVPLPASIESGQGSPFVLPADVRIAGEADAAAPLADLIEARTGAVARAGEAGSMELRIESGGAAESYRLVVDEESVAITGADAAGLFYGVQTVGQLIARDGDRWIIPAVTIEDSPRFAYRGVMLDVARHFQSVDTVKAYIDRAASLKFNVLHLHLSDDQGWRIQLTSRPELTQLASGSSVGGDPGGFYTTDEYRGIVAYAASRHMTVVPEIDMPGHTHAVGVAYPELAEPPVLDAAIGAGDDDAQPTPGELYQGIAVGFSSLKIRDEATYDFVADVFGELAALTPGPYLHLGGDESHGTDPVDFAFFMDRATDIVADLGKTPIAWHEAGAATGLDPDTIGQYWGFVVPTDGMDVKARTFVNNGSQLILSPADAAYLDMKYTSQTALGLAWANGPTSVRRAYEWEPADVIRGIDESDILGVEAPLWTETLRDLGDIDEMAFPRAAAAAEAAWSPATGSSELRTWESFRHRVGAMGPLWTSLGIGFHPADEIPWVTE